MTYLVLLAAFLNADQQAAENPRLTEQQNTQIRELIRETRSQDTKLKEQLVAQQQKLIAEYTEFDLDERRIKRLQNEVTDLQRQLLDNYHRLQTGLRRIAGRERFKRIKLRVDMHFRAERARTKLGSTPSDDVKSKQ